MEQFWHIVDWKFVSKQYDLHFQEMKNLSRGADGFDDLL